MASQNLTVVIKLGTMFRGLDYRSHSASMLTFCPRDEFHSRREDS